MTADTFFHCARCDAPSVDCTPLALQLGYRTCDGFHVEYPTCGHGKYLLCDGCNSSAWNSQNYDGCGCPKCGCQEFYT